VVPTWVNLENSILSERNPPHKNIYDFILEKYLESANLHDRKQISGCLRLGEGGRELRGTEFLWGARKCSKMDHDDRCITQ
jgi:hypothetical protein